MSTEIIDSEIKKLFEKVSLQKQAIAKADKPDWKTNCVFSFTQSINDSSINIQVCSDLLILIKILAFLEIYKEKTLAIAKSLDVKIDYLHQGYSVEDWKYDIQARIKKLNIEKEKKKLAALETRLNAIISPEQKRAMELEEIKRIIDEES